MLPQIDRLLFLRPDDEDLKGDFQTHLAMIRQQVDSARKENSPNLASVLQELARLLSRAGNPHEAEMTAREVLAIDSTGEIAAEALITIGICASDQEDLAQSELALHQAADHCRKIGYKAGLARALHNLSAIVLVTRGKFGLALAYMEEAHAIRADLGMKDWGWPWLRAYIHLLQGNRRRARQALDEMVLEIEPATRIAGGYYFLWARLAIDENEFDKAHEYLRLGLRIATQTGVPDLSLWIRIEHSRYYRVTDNIPAALEWAEDALQLARRIGYRYFEGLALYELALVEWEAGNPSTAFLNLENAQRLFEALGAAYNQATVLYTSSVWKFNLADPQAAQAWVHAMTAIERGGYAFLLEKEQDTAFPLTVSHLRGADPEARNASERILRELTRVQPPPLRVAGLGQFSVWKGRLLLPERSWQKRRTGELFRFLLLQPNRSAGKEAILEALWPERSLHSGEDLLHQSTSALRRILEPDLPDKFPSRYISYEGEQIQLKLPPGSFVDFELFRQVMPSAIQSKDSDRLQDALSLYPGELFPADRYLEWTEEPRASLSALYQEGLLELARLHFTQVQYADALDGCRTLIRLDPWNEEAVLLAMRCYMALGTSSHAIRQYRQLEESLRNELGIQPRNDLRDLAASIGNR